MFPSNTTPSTPIVIRWVALETGALDYCGVSMQSMLYPHANPTIGHVKTKLNGLAQRAKSLYGESW